MILVIGATGTVGSEVVRQLLAQGGRPRALVRDADLAHRRFGERVDVVVGDLNRPETLAAALDGIERVLLLTRQTSRQVDQELAAIDAAAAAGAKRIVKLSVFRAHERSPLQIARQHRIAELAVEGSGMEYTILRPTFFMQNLLGMVRDGALRTAAGDGRVAMIDARDIAAAAVVALTRPGHAGRMYTLTGSEALRFDDVARILSRQTYQQIRHLRVPPEAVCRAAVGAGAEAWFARDLATLHQLLATGYEDITTDDIGQLTGLPSRTMLAFAHDHRQAFSSQQASAGQTR